VRKEPVSAYNRRKLLAWGNRSFRGRRRGGALAHANRVIPGQLSVFPNTPAIGDPVELYGPNEKEVLADAMKSIGSARNAFGVDA